MCVISYIFEPMLAQDQRCQSSGNLLISGHFAQKLLYNSIGKNKDLWPITSKQTDPLSPDLIFMIKSYLLALKWCPISENPIQKKDFTQFFDGQNSFEFLSIINNLANGLCREQLVCLDKMGHIWQISGFVDDTDIVKYKSSRKKPGKKRRIINIQTM